MNKPSEFHKKHEAFRKELQELINRHSMENGADTPDFLLADYLIACLAAFNSTTNMRDSWYGHRHFKYVSVGAPGSLQGTAAGDIGRNG